VPTRHAPSPRPWVGTIAVVFILIGAVLAYLLYRLSAFARASQGSAVEVTVAGADMVLLGGGALLCWVIAAFLFRWRRRQR